MVFYPEEAFVGLDPQSQKIIGVLETTHSLDLTHTSFSLDILTVIKNGDEIPVVAQYHSGSGSPDKSGQYTYKLQEVVEEQAKFGNYGVQFTESPKLWSNVDYVTSNNYIDEGRLFIHGIDDPIFTKYVTTNEEGAYTTYYG